MRRMKHGMTSLLLQPQTDKETERKMKVILSQYRCVHQKVENMKESSMEMGITSQNI
jgi:hypothetical protein